MRYRYCTCDVFTDTRFGGNPLAVFPHAEGLSASDMQQIAREFNFSETAFVFPPTAGNTRAVRIFTPAREVPFAGHPNIGTAFVLATIGELGDIGSTRTVTFEEQAGVVAIAIVESEGRIVCELAAPQALSIGKTIAASLVASAVGLSPADVVTDTHPPQVTSVGLPFVVVELGGRGALERCTIRIDRFEALAREQVFPAVHVYTRDGDGFDLRTRMFAPLAGVPEDPATGSANCALAGLLAHHDREATSSHRWRIAQGVEMGRPSVLVARAEKKDGRLEGTWIAGSSVMVSEGTMYV